MVGFRVPADVLGGAFAMMVILLVGKGGPAFARMPTSQNRDMGAPDFVEGQMWATRRLKNRLEISFQLSGMDTE
jgi:hypothetical protein